MREVLTAALVFLGVWMLCRAIRSALLWPLLPGRGPRMTVLLSPGEDPEGLEETLDALCFLRSVGVLPCETVIGRGISEEQPTGSVPSG